jgi:hypothetical protein
MPQSRPGRWSLILALMAAYLFAAFFCLVISGQKGGATFFSNPYLAGTIIAATASAVGAGGAGLYSIVAERDRSIAVFITTTVGLLVLAYAIAEVAFPH